MNLPQGKKIYFASDFHLGIPDKAGSRSREHRICQWLDSIRHDAHIIYLVGDLFDVWFEYKNVIPKGYARFFGKLAELTDAGLRIEAFTGNHDLWMRGYFEEEFNIPVHHEPIMITINGKQFFIAHGDGLGPGDKGYKFLKKIMSSSILQWLYRRLHPDTGVGLANFFSRLGPKHTNSEKEFLGEDKEWLVLFCKEKLREQHYDYFIFGHRHLAISYALRPDSLYVNLGDWLHYNSFAVFDGASLRLEYFKSTES